MTTAGAAERAFRQGSGRPKLDVLVPALLCLGPDAAVLVVADFHAAAVRARGVQVVTYRSYDFQQEPAPAGELHAALLIALEGAGIVPGATGVEVLSLPHAVAE